MQDRFKFRFWNKERNKMETFEYCSDAIGDLLTKSYPQYEIMQSTGLKDSEGTLIYDGDITQALIDNRLFECNGKMHSAMSPTFNRIHEVKFVSDDLFYQYMLINYDNVNNKKMNDCGKHCYDRVLTQNTIKECGIKIIGNIYENKELLEAKNEKHR